MKRFFVFFVMILAAASFAANSSQPLSTENQLTEITKPITPYPQRDVVFYEEDFEDEDRVAEEWTSVDYSSIAWHKTDLLGEEDDLAWWCGDTLTQYDGDPVGYDNRWLQYLDTPVLNFADAGDALTFTFTGYWLVEDPRLIPPNDPYDGWDGWFVLISTDGGDEFETLVPEEGEGEYTAERISAAERLWDFEEQAGWVFHSGEWGDTTGAERPDVQWVDVEFDMSDYAQEENVVIRFVLTSDNAVAAPFGNVYLEDRSGIWIDDILITDEDDQVFLSNNADDDPVPDELIPRIDNRYGGDHWARTDEDAHSGDWSMWNDDDHFFMNNGLISPPIAIEEGFTAWLELWVYCNLPDWQGDNNALEDFYQCYVTNDEGETWDYLYHDYARDEAGAEDWVRYTPDLPFNDGTVDLSDYAGETIQIQWFFRTNNNHDGGNGDGLFFDDILVEGSNLQPFEASMERLHVPYPLTAGYRLPGLTVEAHNNGLRDLNDITAYWGVVGDNESRQYPIIPRPDVVSDTFEVVELSDYRDRRVPGWTPVIADNYTVYAYLNVEEDADDRNDSIAVENVVAWPTGLYEFGYDNRSFQFTHEYAVGSGAATRFSPGDVLENYSIAAAKFMFNGEQNEDADFTLHVYGAGEDETGWGDELLSLDVTVPRDSCLPNTMTVPLFDQEALRGLGDSDFWLWVEVERDDAWPEIISDTEFDEDDTHYYVWNGNQMAPSGNDYMMQALLVPTADVEPNLIALSEALNFGEVEEGDIQILPFTLWSGGLDPVTISNVEATEGMFEVGWGDEVTLAPGEAVTFEIVFDPEFGGQHFADLIIESDDQTPPEVLLRGEGTQSVDEDQLTPVQFGLGEPYPNPFNSSTIVEFSLEASGYATVSLYDLSGREITRLASGSFTAGRHSVALQADDLSAGVYVLRLKAGDMSDTRKVVLVK